MAKENRNGCGGLVLFAVAALFVGMYITAQNKAGETPAEPGNQRDSAEKKPASPELTKHANRAGFKLGARTAWDGRPANHRAATIAGEAHGEDYLAHENPGSGTLEQYVTEFQIGYHSGHHAAVKAGAPGGE